MIKQRYTESQSIQRCISKSLFNKTMYKNIGADTAGIALWEVNENWPDETGQFSITWVPFLKPFRRKEQLDFGT